MNAVIYARYSSDKQNEQSIDGQIRFCTEYADRMGYKIVDTYIDKAISGTSDNRPQFRKMIDDSYNKRFQYIIVWKLDRFARNRYDSAIYKSKLKLNGVKVLSATEGVGEGDESLLLEAILEAMAENYSKQLAQNVKRGMKETALKCQTTGGKPPLGYKIDINGKYIIDEEKAAVVKYIFEQYADGRPKTEICAELNKRGLKTSSGNIFTVAGLTSILNNKKYIGVYCCNDIEIDGGCPVLVEKEIFKKCQVRKSQNKRQAGHNKAKTEYLLNSKLFCGHCGTPMVGDSATSKTGAKHYYYSCAARKNRHKHQYSGINCQKKREKKDFIEWYIVEQTIQYILQPKRMEMIAENVVKAYEKEFSQTGIKELEKHLTKLNKEFDDLTESMIHTKSQRMIDAINKKAEILDLQIQETEDELDKLRIACKAKITKKDVLSWLHGFCDGDPLDTDYQKKIINTFVNAVYLFDDKVVIYYNVKNGEQVSFIDMLNETEDYSDTVMKKSSDIDCYGSPKQIKSEPIYFYFSTSVFGVIFFREV